MMQKKIWLDFGFRRIHQSYFVVMFCVGVIIGTILALVWQIKYFVSPIWILVVIMILVFVYFFPKLAFIGLAVGAGMILAFFRSALDLVDMDYVRQFYGKTVTMQGIVDGDPETVDGRTSFKLKDLKLGENFIDGKIYVTAQYNMEVARSDTLLIEGKMSEGFGVYSGYMFKPNILKIERANPGSFILNVRNWFAERVKSLIDEPRVSLGLSYLLGMRSGLPNELSENLRAVGLVHIVVASGAHLSILVEIARKIFGKVSRFVGLLFSGLFIVLFMAMVGFTPSILRAGMMSLLTIITWYVGRKMEPWRIIVIVAAVTLVIDPMFVMNLGWLLSFASYAGIMVLGPRFTRICYGAKKPNFVAETIITTVAATVMTLPITLYYFGSVSLISVVANLLILPTLPYAMGLVFLTGVVAGIPGIEMVISFIATKMLDFHIAVVEFFGGMEQFIVKIPEGQWWVFLIYGFIIGGVFCGDWRRRRVSGLVLEGA